MSIRYQLAKQSAKFTKWALKKLNRGATSLPGKVALKLDPHFLTHQSKNLTTIMVTGTNGKTLTTSLLTHILKQKYKVVTNESGSNMIQGITTTLLDNKDSQIAVLEVDEANLKKLTPILKPHMIVLTNVFKDQTERFGEIDGTYQYLVDGAKLVPKAKIISNGDVPLFNHDTLSNPKTFYGFNHQVQPPHYVDDSIDGQLCPVCQHRLEYTVNTYANLGDYHCPNCHYHRPHCDYQVTKILQQNPDSSKFEINGHAFEIKIGGLYNIYNALAAYAAAKELGLNDKEIQAGFFATPKKFGRQEVINFQNKKIILNLVKNPVGFNQIVDLIALDTQPKTLVALFNHNYADGIDESWIWEADFEKLMSLQFDQALIQGQVSDELEKRIRATHFNAINKVETLNEVIEQLPHLSQSNIYILATYTALLDFRDLLIKNNIIKA